jgi:hypothetical protein
VFVVLAMRALIGRLLSLPLTLVPKVAAYAIGTVAAYWTIERVVAFF